MVDITMNIDETLELDYLIQRRDPEPVTVNSDSDEYELDGFETRTSVFKPNKTGTYEINLNNQTYEVKVIDIPDSVVDTFDYLSEGENLDGRNGWTDNSSHMRGITSFSQTFTFNAVGRAVSSGSPSNRINKGECFRSLPNEPYGRVKWRQSTDGGEPSGSSFISFRQSNNDIVKVEMDDTGGGEEGSMFVNDTFIADDNDGNFASDGCTVEFDLTLDYDNNAIDGTATETNSNTTVTINEPFVNSASGLDEIYLWNSSDCAVIADEIEVLGE